MLPLSAHFDQFLRERVYLHNVTPKTAEWYRSVWQVFAKWWVTLPARSECFLSLAAPRKGTSRSP
ncbi:MAG TPA: hypothetical protein VEP46_19155, partial [Vicinamibacterales bacterium]|nr:hypothetical protein [Vicinamibacterales bacterium]